MISKTNF